MKDNYSIYKFTFSDGKVYIGQTSQHPEDRWQCGEGYKNQDVYIPIILDGWDNVKKEILHEHLSLEQANKLEKYYIKKFNSIKNGYNRNFGISHEKGKNLGKPPLILISDYVSLEDKKECMNYIIQNLRGNQGNLLRLIFFFILHDNENMILSKKDITQKLNMEPDKYYDSRAILVSFKWCEIDEENGTLKICYKEILRQMNQNQPKI